MKYSKLKLVNDSPVEELKITVGESEHIIHVKTFLSTVDKIKMLEKVINLSVDEMHFYNTIKLDVFLGTEILFNYTDLEFTEKEKDNAIVLYDEARSLIKQVIEIIETNGEYSWLHTHLMELVDSIYKYNNSILGIMKNITTDYSVLGEEVGDIQKTLSDPENLGLLKDILTKLG